MHESEGPEGSRLQPCSGRVTHHDFGASLRADDESFRAARSTALLEGTPLLANEKAVEAWRSHVASVARKQQAWIWIGIGYATVGFTAAILVNVVFDWGWIWVGVVIVVVGIASFLIAGSWHINHEHPTPDGDTAKDLQRRIEHNRAVAYEPDRQQALAELESTRAEIADAEAEIAHIEAEIARNRAIVSGR